MRDLNIDFMDLYKRVDKFIRDAYVSDEGISGYIKRMECNRFKGLMMVPRWSSDFDELKHIRWIRNQLSHEVSYDSDICEEEDYEWLEDFYNRLFSSEDPLASLAKEEKAERERNAQMARQRQRENREKEQAQPEILLAETEPISEPPKQEKKQSLWTRIKRFFTGM